MTKTINKLMNAVASLAYMSAVDTRHGL